MPGADATPGKSCSIAKFNSSSTGQALVPAVNEHDMHPCSICCKWLLRRLHTKLHCRALPFLPPQPLRVQANVVEMGAGAGIWEHVESGQAALGACFDINIKVEYPKTKRIARHRHRQPSGRAGG